MIGLLPYADLTMPHEWIVNHLRRIVNLIFKIVNLFAFVNHLTHISSSDNLHKGNPISAYTSVILRSQKGKTPSEKMNNGGRAQLKHFFSFPKTHLGSPIEFIFWIHLQ